MTFGCGWCCCCGGCCCCYCCCCCYYYCCYWCYCCPCQIACVTHVTFIYMVVQYVYIQAGGMQRQSRPLASGLPLPQPSGDDNARFLTFRQLADCYSCDICYVGNKARSANSPDCQAKLRAFMPDFALNLRNNMIYSHELISIPKVVCVASGTAFVDGAVGLLELLWSTSCFNCTRQS